MIIFESPETAREIIKEHECKLKIKNNIEWSGIDVNAPKEFICDNYEETH